jgi:triphosphoribosyl-dephospho-CoA synthase
MASVQMHISMRKSAARNRTQHLARLAYQAMVEEVMLAPKPGLVDRRGPGSHTDLSLELMLCSAGAIQPFFACMAELANDSAPCPWLREELALIGRNAERAMFSASGGANAHKGAIWIIGLLVAGAARKDGVTEIVEAASAIARIPDRQIPRLPTHGEAVRRCFGARGARGEAEDGFPHLMQYALPAAADIRVETPFCGFSLGEFVREGSRRTLLRYPSTVVIGDDPWRELQNSEVSA